MIQPHSVQAAGLTASAFTNSPARCNSPARSKGRFPTLLALCLSASLATPALHAQWWIAAEDSGARHDLRILADAGMIAVPVNTFPLDWQAVLPQLQAADPQQWPAHLAPVRQRLLQKYQAQTGLQARVGFSGHSDADAPSTATGPRWFEQSAQQFQLGYSDQHISGQVQVRQRQFADPTPFNAQANTNPPQSIAQLTSANARWDEQATVLDGSFVAARWSQWQLRYGAVAEHYGPAWDAATMVSTNARPAPAMTLSRHAAADDAWLPWSLTMSFADLSQRASRPDAKLWRTRLSSRLGSAWEVGGSWSMQYGGGGENDGLADWYRALFNGGTVRGEENMVAGYDVRWHGNIQQHAVAVYMSGTADDFKGRELKLLKVVYQLGLEWYLPQWQTRLFLEGTDSTIDCSDDTQMNCMYEHGYHPDGYRRFGRNFGFSYDNDSRTLVLGASQQFSDAEYPLFSAMGIAAPQTASWQHSVGWLQLNIDGRQKEVSYQRWLRPAEQRLRWQSAVQLTWPQHELQAQFSVSHVDRQAQAERWPARQFVEAELGVRWLWRFW